MATENRFKMSQERLDALKKELLYLETDKAKEVAEQIKEARSFGDLSENSEYDEAKTEPRASSIQELPSSRALLRMPRSSRRSIPACAREQSPSAAESRFATLMMATKRLHNCRLAGGKPHGRARIRRFALWTRPLWSRRR